jgi:regulator of sirC expression with transglutaminase-like and TPR domain
MSAPPGLADSLAPSDAGSPAARPPRSFDEMASLRDDQIDVARGAAFIARDAYAGLDVDALLARIDALAAPLVARDLAALPLDAQAAEIAHHLYEVVGFRGNEADYYDPKNSLLVDVLDRKLGIPITLALVYVEVARRAGVVARGVGFPGHFLVRIDSPSSGDAAPVFVDPFFGGRVLDRAALERLLRRAAGAAQALSDEHLAPASPRTILVRMLVNLKWIYTTRGDLARAHLALDRLVTLTPESVAALRERGMLAAKLGAVEAARADLARSLELQPEAGDADAIRARIEELGATKRPLN